MTKFAVLLAGAITPTKRLYEQVEDCAVIAADSGIVHAETLNVTPFLWIGDFDSANGELAAKYAAVKRQRHPSDKVQTDGELAVVAAIDQGASSIVLIGGGGGPHFDHALMHFCMALRFARSGIPVFSANGHEEAYPLKPGQMTLSLPRDSRMSIIGFGDLGGLTISGTKWPLDQTDIEFGNGHTLSNRVTEAEVMISLDTGQGVVLVYPPGEVVP